MRITVAVVALALTTAACSGGDPEPSPPPPTATTVTTTAPTAPPPTPTTSPTPAAPTLPASARPDTPTAAESFARFYMQALDYASRTGDTDILRSLGRCNTCVAQARGIEAFFSAGGTVDGGEITVTASRVIRFVRTAALVNVTYSQAAGQTVSGAGKTEVVAPVTAAVFAFTLARSGSAWMVDKLQVVQ